MNTITIEGKEGRVTFVPAHISLARLSKIQKELARLVKAGDNMITADEMRSILKKKDQLIGTLGGMIRAYRLREEMTQLDLAKKSGIQQSHISEMEKNKRPIGLIIAKKLAQALNCDYQRFL